MLLCAFLSADACFACSPDDFILDEFTDRCKTIASALRDCEAAKLVGVPDKAQYKQKLLNAWVDFYLGHGNTPPQIYESLENRGWHESMKTLGFDIGAYVMGRDHDSEKIEPMLITLDLLGEPSRLFFIHDVLASWTKHLDMTKSEDEISDIQQNEIEKLISDDWITEMIVAPVMSIRSAMQNYPEFCLSLDVFMVQTIETWEKLRRNTDGYKLLLPSMIGIIREEIRTQIASMYLTLIWQPKQTDVQ